MGVPESRSSDLAAPPFHRAGTQADGGATDARSGIAERSARQGTMRGIVLLVYREVAGERDWIRLTAIEHPDGRRVTVTLHKSSNTFPPKTLKSMFLQACWAERRSDTPEAETLVAAVLSRKKAVQPEGAYGE
jgi:hypothetical protein